MKIWKRLLQTTCVAALLGVTAMTVTASAAKAPVAQAPEKIPVILDADDVGAMSEMILLWENASPSSSFAAQTVALNLSNYEAVAVVMTTDATDDFPYLTTFCKIGENGLGQYYVYWGGTIYTKTRSYLVTNAGITFRNNNENGSASNTWNVPARIYGIKHVKGATT